MRFSKLFFLLFTWILLVSHKPVNDNRIAIQKKSTNLTSDKQQLETLIRKTYEWIDTKSEGPDFDVIENHKGDKYIGLNLKAHNKKLNELKKTNFFSKKFLDNYNNIGLKIDDNLKTNKMEYFVGDLPPYGNDSNMWCECQDNPEEYWKTLKLTDLKIDTNKASFNWIWTAWKEGSKYKVRAIKENGVWKIDYLQGFDYDSLTKI